MTSDGYTTFTYDGRGRLVKVSNIAIGSEQYRINGLGQRDAKVTGVAPDLSGDANQDGDFWEDVLNRTLYVRAVADTE